MPEVLASGYFLLPTALTLVLGLIALASRTRRGAFRHRLLVSGLVMACLLPLGAGLVPTALDWRIPDAERAKRASIVPEATTSAERRPNTVTLVDSTNPPTARIEERSRAVPAQEPRGSRSRSVPWLTWIVALGIGLTATFQLAGTVTLLQITRRGRPARAAGALATTLMRDMGIRRSVIVSTSQEIRVPITCGTFRPRVLLPTGSEGWPRHRLEVVLRHELAHVLRGDALALGLCRLACTLYWWNPLVWWLARQASGDAEVASDAVVVEHGVSGPDYARALLAVLRDSRTEGRLAGAVALGGAISLPERIETVLRSRLPSGVLSRWAAVSAVALPLLLSGTLAAARPSAAPDEIESSDSSAASGILEDGVEPREQDVLAAVRERLVDVDPMVRRSALNALQKLDGARAKRDAAVRRLLDDSDPDVREVAEIVLGLRPEKPNLELAATSRGLRSPAPGEIDRLGRALGSPDPRQRAQAIRELRRLEGDSALVLVLRALKDPSKPVRQEAADALDDLKEAPTDS